MANINELVKEEIVIDGTKYYIIDNVQGKPEKREIVCIINEEKGEFKAVGFRNDKGEIEFDEEKVEEKEVEKVFIKKENSEEMTKDEDNRHPYVAEKQKEEKEPTKVEPKKEIEGQVLQRLDTSDPAVRETFYNTEGRQYDYIELVRSNNGYELIGRNSNGEEYEVLTEQMRTTNEQPVVRLEENQDGNFVATREMPSRVLTLKGSKNKIAVFENDVKTTAEKMEPMNKEEHNPKDFYTTKFPSDVTNQRKNERDQQRDAQSLNKITERHLRYIEADNDKDYQVSITTDEKGNIRIEEFREKYLGIRRIIEIERELENNRSEQNSALEERLMIEKKGLEEKYKIEAVGKEKEIIKKDDDVELKTNDSTEQAKKRIEEIDKELENRKSLTDRERRAELQDEKRALIKEFGLEEEERQKVPGENTGPNSK